MRSLIVFDAMGVIYKTSDDVADLLIPYLKKLSPDISGEKKRMLYHKLSLGQISSEHFFTRLGFSDMFPKIEKEYLNTCIELDNEFIPLINKIKQNYDIAMLSNDASEWSKHLRQRFNLNKYFKEFIISADVGFRKPSEEIYKIFLKKTKRNAVECIFIDDSIKNLKSAERLGFKTIWFNRNHENIEYSGLKVESHNQIYSILRSLT